jgi:UDP-3-O-[3-hydroxymyristoyl] glucosamine N-acyltransferase
MSLERLLILGAGGQARWALEIARLTGFDAVCADREEETALLCDRSFTHAHVAIGGEQELSRAVHPSLRQTVMARARQIRPDLQWPPMIHPSAWISPTAELSEGVAVLAMASIGPNCVVMEGAILASGARLEHDSVMEPFSYLTTGASTGGGVRIGARTFVGTNAAIKHGLNVPPDCLIGAGVALNVELSGPSVVAMPRLRRVPRTVGKRVLPDEAVL